MKFSYAMYASFVFGPPGWNSVQLKTNEMAGMDPLLRLI
jgi:hypothetical protein